MGLTILHHEYHGASIIVLAALYNALKVVGKNLTDARIIINGAGASGMLRVPKISPFVTGMGQYILTEWKA